MIDLYATPPPRDSLLVMLWLALVIAAPVGEEIIFRGFLFRGWAQTPRAVLGDHRDLLLLGGDPHAVRLVRRVPDLPDRDAADLDALAHGSTLLTMVLHVIINAWATVQTIIKFNWL